LSLYTSPIKASNKSSFKLLLTCAIISSTIGTIGQGKVLRSLANSIWDCLYVTKTVGLMIFSNISSSFAACYCVICPLSLIGVSFDVYVPLAARFIIS